MRRQPDPGFARVDPLRGRVSEQLQERNQRPSIRSARGRSQALRCPSKRGSSNQPLHVVVGCALSSEGVCILGFRPDLHRVQGAVATWVKTGENSAAARRAGGKRGGMQGPCGCARGTPFSVGGVFLQRFHPTPALRGTTWHNIFYLVAEAARFRFLFVEQALLASVRRQIFGDRWADFS